MNSRLLVASILAVAFVFSGCVWLSGNRAIVYNVSNAPLDTSATVEQIGERIRRAARIQGWDVQEIQPQLIYVTKRRGSHSATAAISYAVSEFSIQLRGSENLKQTDTKIHKLYNEWVRELEMTVNDEVRTGP